MVVGRVSAGIQISKGEGSVQVGFSRRFRLVVALIATLALQMPTAVAARSVSLIRDAEIEATLQRFLTPLLEASGLGAGSVRIYIVNDP